MAVGAHDLALSHLGQDVLPWAVANSLADAEALIAQVVELQDERVVLPAIGAGVLAQIRNEVSGALSDDLARPSPRRVDIALPVSRIVLVLVRAATWPAIVVSLPSLLPAPGEFVQRLLLLTAPASPHDEDKGTQPNRRSPGVGQAADGN